MSQKTSLFIAMLFLGVSGSVQSAPLYYTFEGTVGGFYADDVGLIAAAGLTIGSPVNYTFLVDHAATATRLYNDGSIDYVTDDPCCADFFYVDYVQGSALLQQNGGTFNAPADIAEYNFAFDAGGSPWAYLLGLSQDDPVKIGTFARFPTWTVGTAMSSGSSFAYDSTGAYSGYHFTSVLTSISSVAPPPPAPVPLPAAAWLFGSGILALVGWGGRKRRSSQSLDVAQ